MASAWCAIKSTGEETEVDREVMKALRAEEKWLRRRMTGAPVPGDEEAITTILSLDYVSYEGGEDMSPAWLEVTGTISKTRFWFSSLKQS